MPFTSQQIEIVWQKAAIVPGNDPSIFRKDVCEAWIKKADYGNRDSIYGWEVDHIIPGGGDIISNLQPLHWENNVAKGDGNLRCVITSDRTQNIRR